MKQFFRILLLTLILLMVALVSALTTMRVAIHGREVAVPKLVGMRPSDAERQAVENGLLLSVESRFFSNDVAEGRIMSQLPPAGAKVRRGWRVRVAESLGPQRIVTPNLVGQSARAAEMNIRRRGLELGVMAVARIPDLPPDQVVAQSPPADSNSISPKVSVLVAAAPPAQAYLMPDFVGKSLADATDAIREAGMKLGTVASVARTAPPQNFPSPATSADPPPGTILKQSPAAGQKIAPGTVISLEVAK